MWNGKLSVDIGVENTKLLIKTYHLVGIISLMPVFMKAKLEPK